MSDNERAQLVEDLGDGTGRYSDGSRRWLSDNAEGRKPGTLAERHPAGAPPISSDNAHELLAMREQAATDAISRAIADKGGPGGVPAGLQRIARAQLDLATDPSQGQASTRAADWLWRRGGFAQNDDDGRPVVAIQVNLGEELLGEYASD